MSIQCLEAGKIDTRTAGERLTAIWEGLGETTLQLSPRRDLEASMAAIVLANDPTVGTDGITLDDLHYELPRSIDVATGEQL